MEASRDVKEAQCRDRSLTFRVLRGHESRSISPDLETLTGFLRENRGRGLS